MGSRTFLSMAAVATALVACASCAHEGALPITPGERSSLQTTRTVAIRVDGSADLSRPLARMRTVLAAAGVTVGDSPAQSTLLFTGKARPVSASYENAGHLAAGYDASVAVDLHFAGRKIY